MSSSCLWWWLPGSSPFASFLPLPVSLAHFPFDGSHPNPSFSLGKRPRMKEFSNYLFVCICLLAIELWTLFMFGFCRPVLLMVCFERGPYYIVLSIQIYNNPPASTFKCWDYKHELPCPAKNYFSLFKITNLKIIEKIKNLIQVTVNYQESKYLSADLPDPKSLPMIPVLWVLGSQ